MRRILLLLMVLCALVGGVQAQVVEPLPEAEINPDVNITWPPPVYVVRGAFEVRGTANLPGMTNYFIEYRPLPGAWRPAPTALTDAEPVETEAVESEATEEAEDTPWIPVTLPSPAPVVEDVLGVWDTTLEPDGLYELRLVVNVQNEAEPVVFRVSPLRVENEPPPFAITPTPEPTATPLPTQAEVASATPLPTLQPTPTAFDPTPRVTPNRDIAVNVRAGDNTGYSIVGTLSPGEFARIIGRSSTGTGWYLVELSNGQRGWVAGDVVELVGNAANLPLVNPPATPTPVATATPTLPDATIIGVRYDRGEIRQGEQFQIIVRVRNNSGVFLPDTQLLCTVKPANVERSSNIGGMNAFEERDIFLSPVTLDSGGGSNITVDCAIDVNRLVAEIDDNNNFFGITTPLLAP